MIPPFDDAGHLPPGIQPASWAEIEERFGSEPELQRAQMQSAGWLIDSARRTRAGRIVLNGSFTTDVFEPNDVDCVVLFLPGSTIGHEAFQELVDGLPFLDIAIAGPTRFHDYVTSLFGSDRQGVAKGMVEVVEHAAE